MADEEKTSLLKTILGKKEEPPPRWDDGSEDGEVEDYDAAPKFTQAALSAIGGVVGSLASQFAKYLHQVFACNAWGIELTSRRVAWYSTPQIAADVIMFFVLYGAVLGLGILIAMGLRSVFLKDREDEKEQYERMLARGFFWLVVMSVIFFFLPINVFLIGVP